MIVLERGVDRVGHELDALVSCLVIQFGRKRGKNSVWTRVVVQNQGVHDRPPQRQLSPLRLRLNREERAMNDISQQQK